MPNYPSRSTKISDKNYAPQTHKNNMGEIEYVPFQDGEEMWFWFIQAQEARNEGARYTAGLSLTPRPCEPTDILKILDTLYRNRRLERDHFLVLRHYGRRQLAPDPRRIKEARAHKLWHEALDRIEPILIRKGIMHENKRFETPRAYQWKLHALSYGQVPSVIAGRSVS